MIDQADIGWVLGWVLGGFSATISAILGVIWKKVDTAEKTSLANSAAIKTFDDSVKKLSTVAERLSYLDASFKSEVKNLSSDLRRVEGALLRATSNKHVGEMNE
jgi:hypothetical protein